VKRHLSSWVDRMNLSLNPKNQCNKNLCVLNLLGAWDLQALGSKHWLRLEVFAARKAIHLGRDSMYIPESTRKIWLFKTLLFTSNFSYHKTLWAIEHTQQTALSYQAFDVTCSSCFYSLAKQDFCTRYEMLGATTPKHGCEYVMQENNFRGCSI